MIIPIFDSVVHPTLTGKWFSNNKDASIESLNEIIDKEIYYAACAVGLQNIENYNHLDFYNLVVTNKKIFPIAGFSPISSYNIKQELLEILNIGYKAIKLHPRLNGYVLDSSIVELDMCFEFCQKYKLIIFLCTYNSSDIDLLPDKSPYYELIKLVKKYPNVKLVLLHGGVNNIMEYANLVRFNKNILLDLSFTIIKFKESSLDLDIKYLFNTLDQRLCIGTDHPEYSMADLRISLEYYEKEINRNKLENIYYRNLKNFLEFNL